ncbi:acyltransferase [Rhodoferax sp.]|uniref:acyltransferase family protein n=1 Tax=Rhodoferax sp. TaxID=50421 RepID=UPI0026122018|nr:acyltransferase [Rhodoferax sp.]MDD3935992.1 acyltransferase [Rhodoferax sp.]
MKYIIELDGLRGISILLVFLSHAYMGHIIPGGLGVTIFFFISGYIITELMIHEYVKSKEISISNFYLRRWFRLMPALGIYVLACVLLQVAVGDPVFLTEILSVVFYFANYYGIFFGFGGGELISPYGVVWSLAIEEHFYLVYPLLFSLLFMRTRYFIGILVFSLLIILMWRCYLVFDIGLANLKHYRIYKASDTRFDSIVYGVLFALLSRQNIFLQFFKSKFSKITGLLLLMMSLLVRDESFRETFRYSIQGIGLGLLFQHLIFERSVFKSILGLRLFVFFGEISYSLYLYHWLAFVFVDYYFHDVSVGIKISTMILLAVILATLSRYFVELPGLSYGARFRANRARQVV